MRRWLYILIDATILVLALHVFVMLFTGGYSVAIRGIVVTAWKVTPAVIVTLALLVLRLAARHHLRLAGQLSRSGVLALGAVILIIYLANGRTIWTGDTLGARYLPLSILREGNFDLDEFPFLYAAGLTYYLRVVNSHYVSDYPIGTALLALPFYVPSALGVVRGDSAVVTELEKLAAATMVAISAAVLYLVARELASHRMALAIAIAYALGSSSLSVSSQALWQHAGSQLALSVALYSLVRGRREPIWLTFAGLSLALALICRPANALIAAPVGIYSLVYHRAQIAGFLVGGVPVVLFQLWYNARVFGNAMRSQIPGIPSQIPMLDPGVWTTPFLEGLSGVLFSPSRGLFVYSPVFLLAFVGLVLAWRSGGERLLRYLTVGVVLTIVMYSKWFLWWAGHTYGPRFFADMTPVLALAMCPVEPLLHRSRPLRWVFVLLVLWSIAAHALGAFWDDLGWHTQVDVLRNPASLWSWSDNQLVNAAEAVGKRSLGLVLQLLGIGVSRTGAAMQ